MALDVDRFLVAAALVLAGCGGSEAQGNRAEDAAAGGDADHHADAAAGAPDGPGADVEQAIEPLGAPCASDDQCAGSVCLLGVFSGGYCSSLIGECDPPGTGDCADGGVCTKFFGPCDAGLVVGDAAVCSQFEFCLRECASGSDCRAGYDCLSYPISPGVSVCVPPGFQPTY